MLSMVSIISAEQKNVQLDYKKTKNESSHKNPHRSPERIPAISVIFNTDTRQISVESDEVIDAEVFIYDYLGNIIDYSPELNSVFDIDFNNSRTQFIEITGITWTATGKITL